MAGGGKDIDPATELADDDEEQGLPERDDLSIELGEAMLGGATGPLAAGRAVLLRHAKLAPASPGVYRMLDSGELQPSARVKAARTIGPMAVSPILTSCTGSAGLESP